MLSTWVTCHSFDATFYTNFIFKVRTNFIIGARIKVCGQAFRSNVCHSKQLQSSINPVNHDHDYLAQVTEFAVQEKY